MNKFEDSPKSPRLKTIKRLFAVSGNECAFPSCSEKMIDSESGTVLGEICHIRGEKAGSARYCSEQSNEERHGFENLVLMCSRHHTKIDAEPSEYPVECLESYKKDHERQASELDEDAIDEAASAAFLEIRQLLTQAVVNSSAQTGGQTAAVINNIGVEAKQRLIVRPSYFRKGSQNFASLRVFNDGERPVKVVSWFIGWGVEKVDHFRSGISCEDTRLPTTLRDQEDATINFGVDTVELSQVLDIGVLDGANRAWHATHDAVHGFRYQAAVFSLPAFPLETSDEDRIKPELEVSADVSQGSNGVKQFNLWIKNLNEEPIVLDGGRIIWKLEEPIWNEKLPGKPVAGLAGGSFSLSVGKRFARFQESLQLYGNAAELPMIVECIRDGISDSDIQTEFSINGEYMFTAYGDEIPDCVREVARDALRIQERP